MLTKFSDDISNACDVSCRFKPSGVFDHFQVFTIVKVCSTIMLCLTRKMTFNIESLTCF